MPDEGQRTSGPYTPPIKLRTVTSVDCRGVPIVMTVSVCLKCGGVVTAQVLAATTPPTAR